MKDFRISGRVIDRKTKQGIAGLRVDAMDKDLIVKTPIGSAATDAQGAFLIEFSNTQIKEPFANRNTILFFKIFRDKELIASTENSDLWNKDTPDPEITIKLKLATGEPDTAPSFVVRGKVKKSGGAFKGATVNLFGTGIGQEKLLGATNTDDDGQYNIKYSPGEFAVNNNARVVVRVLDSKANIVAASPPFIASPEEDIALSVNTGPELYTLSGFVLNNKGNAMPDLIVRLFGKNIVIGNERLIKPAVTDSEGRYLIEYDPAEFKPNLEDTNRLIIRIFNKSGQLLDPASPLFRASKVESVDITLSGPTLPVPDPKDLEVCRNQLSQAQQALATCEQNQASLRRALQEREQFIKEQQAVISALQNRINALEEIINEDGQRIPVEPSRFGTALGDAVDAIQQGLTNLQNKFVDYGLQELDIQTQVNLQVSRDGQLQIRFPGLNEQVSPQNLSQLQFRLRPIPKSQKNQEGHGQPGSL